MREIQNAQGVPISRLGYGAFKIGRNQKIKYPEAYDLPDEAEANRLFNELLDMGITYFDTAPAYGISEERIGRHLCRRRSEFVLSTKVGERFEKGESCYEFTEPAMIESVRSSLKRLRTEQVDLLFLHMPAGDLEILEQTDAVETLKDIKSRGWTRAIGLSGKSVAAAKHALDWADAVMVEYNLNDQSHDAVMREARERGLAVIVKKGLAAGHLDPEESIRFVLNHPAVSSLIVGGLNLDHMRTNWATAFKH
jgi:aryl-alcohol dehydrogenase-like predicted oxidoreductase